MPQPSSFWRYILLITALTAAGAANDAVAAVVVRAELASGVSACIKSGRVLFVECTLPAGDSVQAFLTPYLREPDAWKAYQGRRAVAIPYAALNTATQRQVIEAIFPDDYVDAKGWWHTVLFQGEEGMESWWVLAEWFTGIGTNYRELMDDPANSVYQETLASGYRVLIPARMLPEAFRAPAEPEDTGDAPAEGEASEDDSAQTPFVSQEKDLTYGSDAQGEYAMYRLKKGEAVYSAVVVRFTDFREHADVDAACKVVLKRSGIKDARKMSAGDKVLIPMDMLSDRYHPKGSERRNAYEAVGEEARRLNAEKMHSRDLNGVVVILDPGHGGRDYGAAVTQAKLYEDEVVYDIVCRIKKLLEGKTQAKVYVTLKDHSQNYEPTEAKSFQHDRDESVLVTPPYENYDAKTSANLRWCLANTLFEKERKAGANERKVVFISMHCDALFNGSMRGVMVYVPGAQYRRDDDKPTGGVYNRHAESRDQKIVKTSMSDRRRDEALSRNLANTLLEALRTHNPPIKVHSTGDPIRNVIRQSGGRTYLPAVLRNTKVPTKILIEAANLTNATDRKRAADPEWRQWFAEAVVAALREHFNS